MRFADPFNPTESELRAWASRVGAAAPQQDWELVLAWGVEPSRLRVLVELASDAALPQAPFFLRALYEWVSYAAQERDFEARRLQYDRWLDVTKGTHDLAVKRWRRRARLIFQTQERFNDASWWADFMSEVHPHG